MKSAKNAKPIEGDVQAEFEAAREAALEAYENFLEAKDHLKAAALAAGHEFKDTANEQFEEALERMTEQKDEIYDSTRDYMRENPMTSAGIAFLGGLLISKLFER